MLLATHIIIATTSIVFSSLVAMFPSKSKLHFVYVLTLATIASGFTLAVINPVHLGRTCISGVVYLGYIITISVVARKRLTPSTLCK